MADCSDGSDDPVGGRSRAGLNAVERRIDPRGLCSICAEPFAGFDLHDDHVMPIGARRADEGLALVRVNDRFVACLPSEASPGGEVFAAVPCAALTHARCNMSKGATRDIGRWRHPSLLPLIVGVNESGERVVVPGLDVLEPSDAWDWNDAQREAHDRGVEALRRRSHHSARTLKTTAEQRAEKLRIVREHHRADVEAAADDMIRRAEAKLAQMTDWREVRDANQRITTQADTAQAEWESAARDDWSAEGWFEGCFEHDESAASLRRWDATRRLGQERAAELYTAAVERYKHSPAGRTEAARLAALEPTRRVKAFNRAERHSAKTMRPADRAKAELAHEALRDLDLHIGRSDYYAGRYAALRPSPAAVRVIEYLDDQGRVIDGETGEILRTVPRSSNTEP